MRYPARYPAVLPVHASNPLSPDAKTGRPRVPESRNKAEGIADHGNGLYKAQAITTMSVKTTGIFPMLNLVLLPMIINSKTKKTADNSFLFMFMKIGFALP